MKSKRFPVNQEKFGTLILAYGGKKSTDKLRLKKKSRLFASLILKHMLKKVGGNLVKVFFLTILQSSKGLCYTLNKY